ncbi:SDR family oxidoreductase [Nocardioides humi]|uniref:SDR family NAD(P)-dependent oxidoreductase n=1 Tax=Nocardioides humi TaxID=449461 RepID=A0ABN2ACA7_9ACTN|nr:SDR family NAD(P)-dependent oxidoreductase [Nocardioides humi]
MELCEGKVAVVTGAASGLGLALSEALLARGMTVALADLDAERLRAEAGRLGRLFDPARLLALQADVGEADSVERLARDVRASLGSVHLLCNNAGVLDSARTWERPVEAWHRVLRTNVEGVVHGLTAFVPAMIEAGVPAYVVNISSTTAFEPRPGMAPYSASKAAVLSISETLAMELDALGAPIGVGVVLPGGVATRLARDLDRSGEGSDGPRRADAGLRRPDDVAAQVVRAVEQDRFYIFTHPERFPGLRARVEQTLLALGSADEHSGLRPTPPAA